VRGLQPGVARGDAVCGPDIVHVVALKMIACSQTIHAVPVLAFILPKVEEILSAVTPEAKDGLTLAVGVLAGNHTSLFALT
jgi:hypothetical protein